MGIFSSKKVINVSSVTYNMAGDVSDRMSYLKEQLMYLNVSGQGIGSNLPKSYLSSTGIGMKRAYKFASTLPQGLPTSSVDLYESTQLEDAVQALLDAEFGPNKYFVEDSYISEGGAGAGIERYLNNTYGYDSITGELSNPPSGFNKDLDIQWQVVDAQGPYDLSPNVDRRYRLEFREDPDQEIPSFTRTVSQSEVSNQTQPTLISHALEFVESIRSDKTITRDFEVGDVSGTTSSITTTGAGKQEITTTTTITTSTDGTTTSIRTLIVDESFSNSKTFYHLLGLGLWPTLDTLYANKAFLDPGFFPVVPLRVDNVDLIADNKKGTQHYKNMRKLGKHLGLDLLHVRDQINDNPDIKEIDHAFLVMGCNMNTQSQIEMEYLFRFWDMCYTSYQQHNPSYFNSWQSSSPTTRGKPNQNSITIQDPQSLEKAYKITIEWNSITKSTKSGLFIPTAKVGQFRIVNGTPVTDLWYTRNNTFGVESSIVTIQHQVSESEYVEIAISGAMHKNFVYEGKTVETTAVSARQNPDDNEGFLIPLFMPIFNQMSLIKKTQLSRECMYLVFNTWVITKKKWYQRGAFKWLMLVIAIVVAVVTYGGGAGAAATFYASVIGAASIPLMTYLLISFAIGYMVSYLVGKMQGIFISLLGEQWGRLMAVVVGVVVSIYASGGNMSSSFKSIGGSVQSIVNILSVTSQLVSAYVQGKFTDMTKEFEKFSKEIEDKYDELNTLSESFFGGGSGNTLSIESLLQIQQVMREDSPSIFLTRTTLVGSDIVDITLGMISDMSDIDIHTRLPGI